MRRAPSFVVATLGSSLLLLAFACGGGNEAKSPAGPSGSASPSSEPAKTDDAGPGSGSAATTTTLALGDGGDLQGAKLQSASRTEIETKGEGTPKPAPGSSEQGRTAKDLQAIIGARRDEARACYDKGLKDHPGIEGDLDIKWVIDPQGNVTNAEVDSTKSQILEPSVGTCIIEIIKKIKFAPSAKGRETRAHYPFNFHPRNTPGKVDAGK